METIQQVKERPILFKGEMVRAILEGRKTQTRRGVKVDAKRISPRIGADDMPTGTFWVSSKDFDNVIVDEIKCPYGKVGDRLWVRETWCESVDINAVDCFEGRPHIPTDFFDNGKVRSAYIHRADGETEWVDDDGFSTERSFWKPSIFMPRQACRLVLEVTSIRVERLQDISREDAIAEGISHKFGGWRNYLNPKLIFSQFEYEVQGETIPAPVMSFNSLWISINGEESFEANPWVWVVEFKKVGQA
ncbi:hypothetical protein [Rufibacter latericius]|uniref:Morphogenetic protein n=1 Tax=Rufibacter latericius TaxID=2487040 RepID=A0A3M9MM31_9BACT|nr:hypothetical protein [Rufibacter latericius]RNI26602.1 hypothetical protein EFB08_11325 [Rufibacter latericius]